MSSTIYSQDVFGCVDWIARCWQSKLVQCHNLICGISDLSLSYLWMQFFYLFFFVKIYRCRSFFSFFFYFYVKIYGGSLLRWLKKDYNGLWEMGR